MREATAADTEAIVSVTVDGWRTAYRGIVAPEKLEQLPIERWRHEIGVGLRRPVEDAFTFVGEIDDAFAGYCYIAAPSREPDPGPRVAELGALYVAPDHWREGVGRTLIEASVDRLQRLPYSEIVLWTFAENGRAVAFYERLGWRRDGAEKIHARSGEPAVRFRRPVTIGPP